MDLFEYAASKKRESSAPLASRMRPRSLDEIVGQEQIIGRDRMLYRAIKADRLRSIILYGPPGTGKTTVTRAIIAAYREDDAGGSDCTHYSCCIYNDQCHLCRKEGYGGGCLEGEGIAWHVR